MSDQRYLRRSPDEVLSWYREFFERHGRIPTNSEIDSLQGPNWMQRKKLGGKLGIALKLGFTPEDVPANRMGITSHLVNSMSNEELVNSLSKWVIKLGISEAPTAKAATRAFRSGDPLVASVPVFINRWGSWDDALAETGRFKFNWTPSECVGAAVRARRNFPGTDTRRAIRHYSQRGVTPTLKDTLAHYPSIRELTIGRLDWNTWEEPATKRMYIRNRKIKTVSYGVLALETANGEIGDFQEANQILRDQDRGPDFSRRLYAGLAPDDMSETAGFIWALDFIEGAHAHFKDKRRALSLPVKDLGIGPVLMTELVHPIFLPELNELKAA